MIKYRKTNHPKWKWELIRIIIGLPIAIIVMPICWFMCLIIFIMEVVWYNEWDDVWKKATLVLLCPPYALIKHILKDSDRC